jgi:hypothetical protein
VGVVANFWTLEVLVMSMQALAASGLEEQRRKLRLRANCRFVDRREFCELLVSNRKLLRVDDIHAEVHGLLEPATGERYLIESEKLFSGNARA